MEKILIIGASGQIGGACMNVLAADFKLVGTYFSHAKENLLKLDFTDKENLESVMKSVKPSVVILASALTNVDYCETHPLEAKKMNEDAVSSVAFECNKINAKLVYISTDYVFDGQDGPYTEEDIPSPISIYGRTKYNGELNAKKAGKWLIIRTGNVFDYGFDEKNFVVRTIERLKNNEQIKVQSDLFASPTLATHIANAIRLLLLAKKSGLYNVCGQEVMSRSQLATQIAVFFKLNAKLITPIKSSELNLAASRPLRGGLISKKLELEVGLPAMPLQTAFSLIQKKMDKNG
ncbi:SDR family oxidoreductase [Candidatus Micrarchaeota archaeon]|nr:SDR family oxidoreductase [Candidatus Micrarchaeota archaeon]